MIGTSPPRAAPKIGAGKLWVFRALTLSAVCSIGFAAAEFALRWRQARIDGSNDLAPGMIAYDPDLGWKLVPGWAGEHRHHDFSAAYAIGSSGFRADRSVPVPPARHRVTMVLGDSFTFGLGVNDDQTFVHLMNATAPEDTAFVNAAVPGYSTDQELLLLEERMLEFRPARVILVVYLGNDLLDNPRAWPLQVGGAKPFFEAIDKSLVLRNTPVPLERKPRAPGAGALTAAVLGSDASEWSWRIRLEQRSEILRLASQSFVSPPSYRAEFAERFAPEVRLFTMLIERMLRECARNEVELTLALLAGRSFLHHPRSVSAQYQEYFREQIVAYASRRGVAAIDLASLMRRRHERDGGEWFFPHDGHLNSTGHRIVAEILAERLGR